MRDLRTWIAKRISWRRTTRVNVNGEGFVSEEIAAALFAERQRLVAKLLKERARRKDAEQQLHTLREHSVAVQGAPAADAFLAGLEPALSNPDHPDHQQALAAEAVYRDDHMPQSSQGVGGTFSASVEPLTPAWPAN